MTKERFEDFMNQVDEAIKELESGDLPIDASMVKYEAGMEAFKKCNEILDSAEKKIEELMPPDENGVLERKKFSL